jgi:hypothetical protein
VVLGAPDTDPDGTGACIPLFTLPAALTITSDAPPLPPPVLAVYPRELDGNACGAGVPISLSIDASLPPASELEVLIGPVTASVVEIAGRGLVANCLSTGIVLSALTDILVRVKSSGVVVAYGPSLLQFRMQAHAAVYSAHPPLLVVAVGSAAVQQRSVQLRGRSLNKTKTIVLCLCDAKIAMPFTLLPDTVANSGLALLVEFSLVLDPECPEAVFVLTLDGGDQPLVSTFILPVLAVDAQTVAPSTVFAAPAGTTIVTVTFASPLGPFPFALLLGDFLESVESALQPSGTELMAEFDIPTVHSMSATVALTVHDLASGSGREALTSKRTVLVTFPLDIVLLSTAATVTSVSPSRVNTMGPPKNVLAYVIGCHGRNDAYTVKVGPYSTIVHHHGPFFMLFDILVTGDSSTGSDGSNGNDELFAPGSYPITVSYRGQLVVEKAGMIEFVAPEVEGFVASAISPLWLFASGTASREFVISGSGLTATTLVEFSLPGVESISTDELIRAADGTLITFSLMVPNPGTYKVTLRTVSHHQAALLAFISVPEPTVRETFPNGTIPLGPMPAAASAARVATLGADAVLSTLTLRFDIPTSLMRLPVEFYVVFESDGVEDSSVRIDHEPSGPLGSAFTLVISRRGQILPAEYRLCIRSAIAADASATANELTGSQALLSFDYTEFVPIVVRVWPLLIHASVLRTASATFRRIVLMLENADGNLPPRDKLRATVDSQPAPIYAVGGNFVVIELPYGSLTVNSPLETSVISTLTDRTVLSAFDATGILITGNASDAFVPYGLQRQLIYDDGTKGPLFITASGARGMDTIMKARLGTAECTIQWSSYDSLTCAISRTAATHLQYGAVLFYMYTTNAQFQQDQPTGTLSALVVAPITVVSTSQVELSGGLRRVTIAYKCKTNLSQMPLAPRIFGSLLYRLSDIRVDASVIAFTIQRIKGDLNVGVELYDVSYNNDPERATAFLQLQGARVTFSSGDDLPIWAIILIAVAGGVGGIVAFLLARWLCCSSKVSTENNDDDDSFADEDEGDACQNNAEAADSPRPADQDKSKSGVSVSLGSINDQPSP